MRDLAWGDFHAWMIVDLMIPMYSIDRRHTTFYSDSQRNVYVLGKVYSVSISQLNIPGQFTQGPQSCSTAPGKGVNAKRRHALFNEGTEKLTKSHLAIPEIILYIKALLPRPIQRYGGTAT